MLDVFTSEHTYAKYIPLDKVALQVLDVSYAMIYTCIVIFLRLLLYRFFFVSQLFDYLLKNGYFECFRALIDERVPPMIEPSIEPPTPFASSLLDLLQRPLKLVHQNLDSAYK